MIICVLDQALNGGTYLGQTPIEVRPEKDNLLHATARHIVRSDCADLPLNEEF